MKKRLWNMALVLILCLCILPAAGISADAVGGVAFFAGEEEVTLNRLFSWDALIYGSTWGEIVDTRGITARQSGNDRVYTIDADAITIAVCDGSGAPVEGCDKEEVPDAGEYSLGLFFTGTIGDKDYTDAVVCAPADVTIDKRYLDVEADEQYVQVGGELPELTYTITGFVNGDNAGVISGEPEICPDETPDLSETGVYFLSVNTDAMSADNYEFNPCFGLLYVLDHIHHFTGEAALTSLVTENDTIVVTCDAEGCPENGEVMIRLEVPEEAVYDGGVWYTVGLYSDIMIPLSSEDIVYSGEPYLPGTYTASLTYGGVTASVTYEVAKRPLEIVVGDLFIEVGDEAPDAGEIPYTYRGFAFDEDESVLIGAPVLFYDETPDTSGTNVYYIYAQPGTLEADNYQFEFDWSVGTLYVLEHVHEFTGEVTLGTTHAENDTIVVVCGAADCPDGGAAMTLYAPEDAVYDGATGHTISVGSDNMIPLDEIEILYQDSEGEEVEYPLLPGTYTASVTYEDVTASVTYEVAKRTLTLTADDKRVSAGAAEPVYTYTISGLAEDHEVSGEIMVDSAAANLAVSGTYEINVHVAELIVSKDWDDVTEYYDIVTVPGTLTVVYQPTSYRVKLQSDGHGSAETDYQSARSGRRITITADADEGFVVKEVTVTTATGRKIIVTDNGDGTYTFSMPSAAVTIHVVFGVPFADVEEDHPFAAAIAWAYTNQLMDGRSEDTFDRVSPVTRQQVWRFLARVLTGQDTDDMSSAKDWAVEQGISDGSRPGEAAIRQELITMLWQACGAPAAELSALERFSDTGDLSGQDAAAMAWAVEAGIVGGYEDGTVRPAATTTRGAFAAVLYRWLTDTDSSFT